jgi:hypothetical protein
MAITDRIPPLDEADSDNAPRLSAAGERRRDQILALARHEARAMHHRRRRARVGVAAALAAVVVALVLFNEVHPRGRSPQLAHDPSRRYAPAAAQVRVSPSPRPATPRQPAGVVIARIQTDRTITARLALPPQRRSWRLLDDDELLRQLADAGRPAGIAYLRGQALLLYHDRPPDDARRTH